MEKNTSDTEDEVAQATMKEWKLKLKNYFDRMSNLHEIEEAINTIGDAKKDFELKGQLEDSTISTEKNTSDTENEKANIIKKYYGTEIEDRSYVVVCRDITAIPLFLSDFRRRVICVKCMEDVESICPNTSAPVVEQLDYLKPHPVKVNAGCFRNTSLRTVRKLLYRTGTTEETQLTTPEMNAIGDAKKGFELKGQMEDSTISTEKNTSDTEDEVAKAIMKEFALKVKNLFEDVANGLDCIVNVLAEVNSMKYKKPLHDELWVTKHLEKIFGRSGVESGKDDTRIRIGFNCERFILCTRVAKTLYEKLTTAFQQFSFPKPSLRSKQPFILESKLLKNMPLQPFLRTAHVTVQRCQYLNSTWSEEKFVNYIPLERISTTTVLQICFDLRRPLLQPISVLKERDSSASDKEKQRDTDRDGAHQMEDTLAERKLDHTTIFLKKMESNDTVEKLKTQTNVKSTGTEVKKEAEKVEETTQKEEERTTGKAKKQEKIKWWVRHVALALKLFQFLLNFWIIGLIARPASASFSCTKSQTAELGEQGTIVCSFPDNIHAVYWYGDIGDGISPLITYIHQAEEKNEFCLENKNYDVLENGSLLICDVAVWHERNYTVIMYSNPDFFEEMTVFLQVIVSPGNQSATVQCDKCREEYYHSVGTRETLSCSVNMTRPRVKIEWIQQYPQGDSLTATQTLKISNNSNGTYNSSANVRLETSSNRQLALLACVATYPASEWRRETQILLDFTKRECFDNIPSSILFLEINRRAEILCGKSDSRFRIWKRIPSAGEPEMIGFRSDDLTQIAKKITGIEISSEGNLVFPSPQIQHEGNFACIHSDGLNDQIQKTTIVLLIPPSPPYIQITGCDDAGHTCVLNEDINPELTCNVNGVYPNATLQWIAKDSSLIVFHNSKTVVANIGQTYHVLVSAAYKVSEDIVCGKKPIYIACRLEGPISRVIKTEREVQLNPKYCKTKNTEGAPTWTVWVFVPLVTVLLVICLFLFRFTKAGNKIFTYLERRTMYTITSTREM